MFHKRAGVDFMPQALCMVFSREAKFDPLDVVSNM